ncbi:MAG TPA: hypothetical protein VFP89_14660 [Propionibacteriaceae bacterium]|nr:hypothetical protein [Propionibacteriaceae bacterium]
MTTSRGRMHAVLLIPQLLVLVVASGCNGGGNPAPRSDSSSAPPPTASTSAPARPSPTAPSKVEDQRLAAKALVTAKDLGKPWVKPPKVNSAGGKKGELCPGRPSLDRLLPPLASARVGLVEGGKTGASIGSFTVRSYPHANDEAFGKAWDRAIKGCAAYKDAAGLFVVTTAEGPASIATAEKAFSRAERVFYDAQHKKLAYARHVIAGRQGRLISEVEYAFLTSKSDPKAKDFSAAQRLLTVQLAKTETVFGS